MEQGISYVVLRVQRSVVLPYSSEDMFSLVNRIEDYPEFLPWCHSVEVEKRHEDSLIAKVQVGGGRFQYAFQTRNEMKPHQFITVSLQEGPFKHLEAKWMFGPDPAGSVVSLQLELELLKKTATLAAKPFVPKITDALVKAFCKRAQELYGCSDTR